MAENEKDVSGQWGTHTLSEGYREEKDTQEVLTEVAHEPESPEDNPKYEEVGGSGEGGFTYSPEG